MNKIELPSDPKIASKIIDLEAKHRQLEIERGILGRFFGSNDRVPTYIAGLIAFISVIAGLAYTFLPDSSKILPTGEFWKIVSPIITACLAYIFGAATKKNEE
jgi:peptidoglycan/LPS O-acetylase OafA/YrhL